MKTLIIGCKTLENELSALLQEYKENYEIVWIEPRLHNSKPQLLSRLQQILDEASADYDRVLMATGFCGNSILGLRTGLSPVIFPRVDDCTSLLFGSCRNKLSYLDSYFLTEGWLKGDRNIWSEYTYAVEKYGENRAKQIFHTLFSHYRRVLLVDTGCYPLDPSLETARKIADAFSLDCQVAPGTLSYLKALLWGPWDSARFLTVPPDTVITALHLTDTY